jgi:hypothetical protein
MGYDLKAKAILAGSNKVRGSTTLPVPYFTLNPVDGSAAEFGTIVFTAEATSPDKPPSPILGYYWQYRNPKLSTQWITAEDGPQLNGTVVSGSQTNTVTLTNTSGAADGLQVRCVATNKYGEGYSSTAKVTIISATWYIITEAGDSVVDEPAVNFIIDERSN